MPAGDVLRDIRSQNYGLEKPPKSVASDEPDHDPDEPNRTSRIIKLTEEEAKDLEQYGIRPGEEMILEVHGNLEGDHFHVLTVNYSSGKGSSGEKDMAKQVAGLIRPSIRPGPS